MIRFVWGVIAASMMYGAAHAQISAAHSNGFDWYSSGNSATYSSAAGSVGKNAQWNTSGENALDTRNRLGRMEFFSNNNKPSARGTHNLPVPNSGGRTVPVTVTQPLSKMGAAKTLARFASRVALPIALLDAMASKLDELDVDHTFDQGTQRNKFTTTNTSMVCAPPNDPNPQSPCTGPIGEKNTCSAFRCRDVAPSADGTPRGQWGWDVTYPHGYQEFVGYQTVGMVQSGGSTTELSEQDLADKIAAESGWPQSGNEAIVEAFKWDAGNPTPQLDPIPTDGPMTVSSPPTVEGPAPTVTTTPVAKPDGTPGTRTTTTTTTYNTTNSGSTVNITNNTTTTTTNVYNDGTTDTTTESTAKPQEKPDPVIVCGLPDTPPCKIDETGTPTAPAKTSAKDADDALKPAKDFAADPKSKLPALPDLNWAFQLPTGCGLLPTPAFEPFVSGLDICQFQPIFHDIMSVIWVITGLFAAIGTFWRSTYSAN